MFGLPDNFDFRQAVFNANLADLRCSSWRDGIGKPNRDPAFFRNPLLPGSSDISDIKSGRIIIEFLLMESALVLVTRFARKNLEKRI